MTPAIAHWGICASFDPRRYLNQRQNTTSLPTHHLDLQWLLSFAYAFPLPLRQVLSLCYSFFMNAQPTTRFFADRHALFHERSTNNRVFRRSPQSSTPVLALALWFSTDQRSSNDQGFGLSPPPQPQPMRGKAAAARRFCGLLGTTLTGTAVALVVAETWAQTAPQ